jgi:hypothetical protein
MVRVFPGAVLCARNVHLPVTSPRACAIDDDSSSSSMYPKLEASQRTCPTSTWLPKSKRSAPRSSSGRGPRRVTGSRTPSPSPATRWHQKGISILLHTQQRCHPQENAIACFKLQKMQMAWNLWLVSTYVQYVFQAAEDANGLDTSTGAVWITLVCKIRKLGGYKADMCWVWWEDHSNTIPWILKLLKT